MRCRLQHAKRILATDPALSCHRVYLPTYPKATHGERESIHRKNQDLLPVNLRPLDPKLEMEFQAW